MGEWDNDAEKNNFFCEVVSRLDFHLAMNPKAGRSWLACSSKKTKSKIFASWLLSYLQSYHDFPLIFFFRLNEEMSEIALELERIGFRTPTVFQCAWTPARDRLGTGSRKSAARLTETPRSGGAVASACSVLPEELSVLTPVQKVNGYLGK